VLVEQQATLETRKAVLPRESVRRGIIASSTTTVDSSLDADIADLVVSKYSGFTPADQSSKDAGRQTTPTV